MVLNSITSPVDEFMSCTRMAASPKSTCGKAHQGRPLSSALRGGRSKETERWRL